MNSFQDDFDFWKSKWILAREGITQVVEQLKLKFQTKAIGHPLLECNLITLLKDSQFHILDKQQSFGSYQLYHKVPTFFVLQGDAKLQCVNTQGDNQTVKDIHDCGILEIRQSQMKQQFGESNITIVTKFEIVAVSKVCMIELNPQKMLKALTKESSQITLRQEMIMRKYMLIALKHIRKQTKVQNQNVVSKVYLLEGRACYYNSKTKLILSCYEEGYFNTAHLEATDFKVYFFEGARYMILEQQMLKDEAGLGVEAKRHAHLQSVNKKYADMSNEQRVKTQEKLIKKYGLNSRQVDKYIYLIQVQKPQKTLQRKLRSKKQLSQTNSSLKQKCAIRIRKTKKVI